MRSLLILAAALCLGVAPPPAKRCLDGIKRETGADPLPVMVEQILDAAPGVDGGLILSLIAIESNFNPAARSHKDAYGLMQVTQGAANDAARYCGLPVVPVKLLTHPALNVQYGSCYLKMWLAQTNSEMEALVGYNGGYRQWENLKAGRPLAPETANYVVSIRRLREQYCSYK